MTTAELREAFAEEIDFLQDLTAYEHDLVPFETEKEVAETIHGWMKDGIEFPSKLGLGYITMLLWNTFIAPDEETKARIEREEYDQRFKAEHPDWLCFDYYYDNGGFLFIDPEMLDYTLRKDNYDQQHRDIIINALRAYHQSYMDNL
jgi:hypothetical protein